MKNVLDKSTYFYLIAHLVGQLLRSPAIQLQTLYDQVSSYCSANTGPAKPELLRSVSLSELKSVLQSEPALFVLSSKNKARLQPASLKFVENYLALCPGVLQVQRAALSSVDAMLPVSTAPKHVPGAYQQMQLWMLLRVKQNKWQALFTFRANRKVVFYIHVENPNRSVETVASTKDIIKACQISISTDEKSGAQSLTYQFVNKKWPKSIRKTLSMLNNLQPALSSHPSAGKFALSQLRNGLKGGGFQVAL
jgi:hypothetical protein